jgi:haloalkane dehalogenase
MNHYWLDRSEYPFEANSFQVNGHQLHYIDEGEGETILFVHGTPSWSFDFRRIIARLKHSCRCIAIDHMGFGLSDKPEHYDYSTKRHAKTLEQFILDKGLRDITLVVHDFGGPIGLNFAMDHPGMVKRIVIMNSWLWSSRDDPDFIKFSKVLKSPLLPFLYRYLNFSPKVLLPKSFGDNKISAKLLKQYTKPFEKRSQRNGPLAFARSLLHDQDWFQELWDKRELIADKPVLFVWGMKDPLIKPAYLEKFLGGFPGAKAIRLETSGHYPQEEQPALVLDAILAFLAP